MQPKAEPDEFRVTIRRPAAVVASRGVWGVAGGRGGDRSPEWPWTVLTEHFQLVGEVVVLPTNPLDACFTAM